MHICAINGSLRGAKGVTHRLLEQLRSGVEKRGGTWDEVILAELKVEACRACNHCQRSGTYRCIFETRDQTAQIFDRMQAADLLIWATPVYVLGLSSNLKRLLERIYARAPISGAYLTSTGLFFHATDRRITGKPFVSLVVCDNLETLTVRNTQDYFGIFERFMETPRVGRLERRSAAAWQAALKGRDPVAKAQAEAVLEAYARAGEELVSRGRIGWRTRRAAERPMVHVPTLVRLARHIPFLRQRIARVVQARAGVMMGVDEEATPGMSPG